jgi:hypothetical protein
MRAPTGRTDRFGLQHAFYRERGGVVDRLHLAADDRGMLDRGEHHTVTIDVEAELRLAGGDIAEVVNVLLFADVLPVCLGFEAQLLGLRHRQLGSGRHELAVPQAASRSAVHDVVVLCRDLGGRHSPLRGRGAHEHDARRRTGAAEGVVEITNRSRTVGVLVAVRGVAESLLDAHAAPVGVQFVGGHERQRGADAGAHLRTVGDDEDRAVGFDPEIDARVERRALRARFDRRVLRPDGLGQHLRCDDQGTGRKDAAEEPAPADVLENAVDDAHRPPPGWPDAAVLIAARIR